KAPDMTPYHTNDIPYPTPPERTTSRYGLSKGEFVLARRQRHMAKTVKRAKELTEVSEAQIAVHWKEEAYYQPSEKFKAQANLRDPHVFDRFGLDKFPDCF